jgi:antitoxin FitA
VFSVNVQLEPNFCVSWLRPASAEADPQPRQIRRPISISESDTYASPPDDIVISLLRSVRSEAPMAQFVVRNLEDDVTDKLKRRARRHGRSMEDEVRHILRHAAADDRRGVRRLGSHISARFKGIGLTRDLPEVHGQPPRAADFSDD